MDLTPRKLRALLRVLRDCGVHRYSNGKLSIDMAPIVVRPTVADEESARPKVRREDRGGKPRDPREVRAAEKHVELFGDDNGVS